MLRDSGAMCALGSYYPVMYTKCTQNFFAHKMIVHAVEVHVVFF